MRKYLVVCLLILACLLTGCTDPLGNSVTHSDMTLTLPGDFVDLSGEDYAQDADFMYGRKTLVLMGLSEKKSDLTAMSLKEYTANVLSGNQITAAPEVCGDGFLFTYETPVANTPYTYTVATFESESRFWIFQFYCPSANLEENQPEIRIILESIRKSQ